MKTVVVKNADVPGGQDALLFGWLQTLCPIWARVIGQQNRLALVLAG